MSTTPFERPDLVRDPITPARPPYDLRSPEVHIRNEVERIRFIRWLVDHASTPPPETTAPSMQTYAHQYLAALLKPDARAAVRITGDHIKTPAQIELWWEYVIQPTMYAIGDLWAQGRISVGQEHLATAITQRVMSAYYPLILELPRPKGPVIVTASPGEYHEIGPRLVADIFEMNGWDVYYTGANTPALTVIELVQSIEARFVCVSTTLVTSLRAVSSLIAQVRAANLPSQPKILVGGQAYSQTTTLWQEVGADHLAANPHDGIAYLEAHASLGVGSANRR